MRSRLENRRSYRFCRDREVVIGSGAMPTAFHLKLGRYFREITGAPLCDGSLAVPFRGVGWFPAIR